MKAQGRDRLEATAAGVAATCLMSFLQGFLAKDADLETFERILAKTLEPRPMRIVACALLPAGELRRV